MKNKKITLKQIFTDHFELFWKNNNEKYPEIEREHIYEEVMKMIDFKCKKCGYEEKVPSFVAFERYTPEEFDKATGSPISICLKCDGDMIIKSI